MDVQTSSLSAMLKHDYLEHTLLDFGWQHKLGGKPVVVYPTGGLDSEEVLAWVHPSRANCYSSFGKLGQGLGGFTVKRKDGGDVPEGCEMVAAKVYCGAWVHFLKAQGMPALTICKSTWFAIICIWSRLALRISWVHIYNVLSCFLFLPEASSGWTGNMASFPTCWTLCRHSSSPRWVELGWNSGSSPGTLPGLTCLELCDLAAIVLMWLSTS